MPKIFLTEFPCDQEFLQGLTKLCPEIDAFSFYSFLSLRQVTSDLENSMESYFSNYGVSTGRFMLLLLLSSTPEGMMPSELAQQCGVTQATISGLLQSLEKAEFITRHMHVHDRRACMILISAKGQELINQIRPEFFDCLNGIMGQFSVEENQKMVDWLGRFNKGLKSVTDLKQQRKDNRDAILPKDTSVAEPILRNVRPMIG